jgi:hypothetical protein
VPGTRHSGRPWGLLFLPPPSLDPDSLGRVVFCRLEAHPMNPPLSWSEGKQRTAVVAVVLGLLIWVDLLLMRALHVDGGADTDSINFGLSAIRFDLLQQQPHPPGYPGYVLWLKLIHWLVPSLAPLEIAEWGSRLCGLFSIPASYWACRQFLDEPQGIFRPLLAATLAALHPMLVKYGSDGQSHAAEALCTFLLFGATAVVVHRSTIARRLLLVVVFALAGAVRPNIPLLLSPMLLWVFWRRPWKEWLLALFVGALALSLWAVPLVTFSGGWTLYRRATAALLTDFYGATDSVFGARATWKTVLTNVNIALVSATIAAIPLVAWSRGRGTWRWTMWATVAINVVFYAVFYCAETGYLIAVAALSCLAPASWPPTLGRLLRGRFVLAVTLCPLFLFLAPPSLPLVVFSRIDLPTFSQAVARESFQKAYRRLVCEAAAGKSSLALSNDPHMGAHRGVPLQCPNVLFASWLGSVDVTPSLDSLIIASARGMVALPTGIPLEAGPPVEYRVPVPVERVLLAPDATAGFVDQIGRQALCPRLVEAERALGDDRVLVWPARCFPRLQVGNNVLRLTTWLPAPP